ncbi:MAG: hypothetical protein APF76_04805 [Desulfitibacter sp. BRH_c19]|nr:MAG: hypothetical protein APF76_04805 [Desulfitibacter sp. BRH_c19]
MSENKIVMEGIYSHGFGVLAKKIMRDSTLRVGPKALYSYLITFAGAGVEAFPKKSTICKELGIHPETYNSYLSELIKRDLIRVEPRRNNKGHFIGNLYKIITVPDPVENKEEKPHPEKNRIRKKTVSRKKPDTVKTPIHNNNSSSFNNNSNTINNNANEELEAEQKVKIKNVVVDKSQEDYLEKVSQELNCDIKLILSLTKEFSFSFVKEKLELAKQTSISKNINGWIRKAVEEDWIQQSSSKNIREETSEIQAKDDKFKAIYIT